MAETFYTLLTKAGQGALANATTFGGKVNFTKFKVGDIIEKLSTSLLIIHPAENEVRADLSTGKRYKYNKGIGWHELVNTKYQPGFWRLGFPI